MKALEVYFRCTVSKKSYNHITVCQRVLSKAEMIPLQKLFSDGPGRKINSASKLRFSAAPACNTKNSHGSVHSAAQEDIETIIFFVTQANHFNAIVARKTTKTYSEKEKMACASVESSPFTKGSIIIENHSNRFVRLKGVTLQYRLNRRGQRSDSILLHAAGYFGPITKNFGRGIS